MVQLSRKNIAYTTVLFVEYNFMSIKLVKRKKKLVKIKKTKNFIFNLFNFIRQRWLTLILHFHNDYYSSLTHKLCINNAQTELIAKLFGNLRLRNISNNLPILRLRNIPINLPNLRLRNIPNNLPNLRLRNMPNNLPGLSTAVPQLFTPFL